MLVQKDFVFFQKIYSLISPYGLKSLFAVFAVSFLQALTQFISVAAIFPFLSLVANPQIISESHLGTIVTDLLPGWGYQEILIATGVALIVALFAANAVSLFGEYYRARFTWRFTHWLRMQMLSQISARAYSWFAQQNSAILIKKISQDINQFSGSVLSPLIDSTARLLTSLFLLIGMLWIEPLLVSITAAILLLVYVVSFFGLTTVRKKISEQLKTAWRGVFKHATQYFTGIKVIRTNNAERFFKQEIENHSQKQSQLQKWLPVIANAPRYLIEPIVFSIIILFVLINLVEQKDLMALLPSLGFLALAGYRLLPAVQMIYSQLSNLSSMKFVLEEVYEEFHAAELHSNKNNHSLAQGNKEDTHLSFNNAITLDNISFSYPDTDKQILKKVSCTIPFNHSVAFIGETGSGKSTLIDIILGLQLPSSGAILIDNKPLIDAVTIQAWQSQIGYVPQEIFLIDDTICKNIAFGVEKAHINDEKVRKAATMAQLQSFIEQDLKDQYDTLVGERGIRLSGGQRQRIALARALYHNPKVLILDEATSALDNETEASFMEVIYNLTHDLTIIMVAHRLSSLKKCNKIFCLEHGQLSENHTIQE